jgi:hypothetical protein
VTDKAQAAIAAFGAFTQKGVKATDKATSSKSPFIKFPLDQWVRMRLLPPLKDEGEMPWKIVKQHFIRHKEGAVSFNCPRTVNRPCPACMVKDLLNADGDPESDELARQWSASSRGYARAITRGDEEVVQPVNLSKTLMDLITNEQRDGEGEGFEGANLTDLKAGRDLAVKRLNANPWYVLKVAKASSPACQTPEGFADMAQQAQDIDLDRFVKILDNTAILELMKPLWAELPGFVQQAASSSGLIASASTTAIGRGDLNQVDNTGDLF